MQIHLRFFASVREALSTSAETVDVPDHIRTVGDVRVWLIDRGEPWAQALSEGRAIRMAYNQQMTSAETAIAAGSEVAFFPPVTGG